jgi:uncharacterized protein (TIGR03790 family)
MSLRHALVSSLLLAGCSPSSQETGPVDTAGSLVDSTVDSGSLDSDSNDTGGKSCGILESIAVLGDGAWPGATVGLQVTLAPGHDSVTVTWDVPDGTLSSPTGTLVEWTVGLGHDPDLAEDVTVTATATAPGCADEHMDTTVVVDWPERLRVVVVYNPSAAGSEDVARYYLGFRDLPEDALCPIASEATTDLAGADFPAWIDSLQACIDAVGPQVWYVVPVFGVPYRVTDRIFDIGGSGSKWAVSLDAMAFFGAKAVEYEDAGWNPIRQEGSSIDRDYADFTPFGLKRSRLTYPVYLVARIDGTDRDAAMDLVDRTAAAEKLAAVGMLDGTVYVDGNEGDTPPAKDAWGAYSGGEANMWGTRWVFEDLGWYPVVWDGNSAEFGTEPAPLTCPDALYYAGWYSYNNYNDAFTWTIGAIGGHLDSCSACDIRASTSWSARALQEGITATFGAVNEPYVAGMPEYDQFFLYLTQGASFAEAGYEATYISRWMMMWVGDPLYRPYPSSL